MLKVSSVCVECLIGKQNKPTLFKVTECHVNMATKVRGKAPVLTFCVFFLRSLKLAKFFISVLTCFSGFFATPNHR